MQANFNGEFSIGVVEALQEVPSGAFKLFFGFKLKFNEGEGELGTGGEDVLWEETLLLP